MQLRILCDDITTSKAQAIVNPASESLLGTSGLDGRIYRAGGLSLQAACSSLGSCPEGKAVLTYGYKLPARYVIHAVAPFWRGGSHREEALLAACYRNVLALAREKELTYIAFSSLGTGKRFPLSRAAAVAIPVLYEESAGFSRIDMVCETAAEAAAYTTYAVRYVLHQCNVKNASQTRCEQALAALMTLRQMPGGKDPLAEADRLVALRRLLRPFAGQKALRSLPQLEQMAAQILRLYEQPEANVMRT